MAAVGPVFQGSCLCGSAAFQVKGKPKFSVLCHCSICQRWYGAPLPVIVGFPSGVPLPPAAWAPLAMISSCPTVDNNVGSHTVLKQDKTSMPLPPAPLQVADLNTQDAHAANLAPASCSEALVQRADEDKLLAYRTSKDLVRFRCGNCGCPVYEIADQVRPWQNKCHTKLSCLECVETCISLSCARVSVDTMTALRDATS